jgi:DNA-binding GntR family transcriptional regulator
MTFAWTQTDTPSQAAKAYWVLAERIIRLDLPPGSILHDRDLTTEIGIGRTPVREALQRLSVEGLVTHYPHRGMVVSDITAANTRDIYEFRMLIDSEAVRLAAMRRSDEEAALLRRIAQLLSDLAKGDDVHEYTRVNREIYDAFGRACGNAYIAETLPRIFNLHMRLWFFISSKENNWHRLATLHSETVEDVTQAIEARDPDSAVLAMRSYISARQKDVRRLI